MRALKIKVEDTSRQTEAVHDSYKDSLDDVLDSYINDEVGSTININPYLLRQTTSSNQLGMLFDVPLPLGLFSEAVSGADKNFNPFAKRSSSLTLPPSHLPKKL